MAVSFVAPMTVPAASAVGAGTGLDAGLSGDCTPPGSFVSVDPAFYQCAAWAVDCTFTYQVETTEETTGYWFLFFWGSTTTVSTSGSTTVSCSGDVTVTTYHYGGLGVRTASSSAGSVGSTHTETASPAPDNQGCTYVGGLTTCTTTNALPGNLEVVFPGEKSQIQVCAASDIYNGLGVGGLPLIGGHIGTGKVCTQISALGGNLFDTGSVEVLSDGDGELDVVH